MVLFALIAGGSGALTAIGRSGRTDQMSRMPRVTLWAWERRENLNFIDPDKTAVAYLARTLDLEGDSVRVRARVPAFDGAAAHETDRGCADRDRSALVTDFVSVPAI